jgi:hypothetical protein
MTTEEYVVQAQIKNASADARLYPSGHWCDIATGLADPDAALGVLASWKANPPNVGVKFQVVRRQVTETVIG